MISADDMGGILGNPGDPGGSAGGIKGSRAAQSRAHRRTNTVEAAVARHQAQLALNGESGSRMSGYNSSRISNNTGYADYLYFLKNLPKEYQLIQFNCILYVKYHSRTFEL